MNIDGIFFKLASYLKLKQNSEHKVRVTYYQVGPGTFKGFAGGEGFGVGNYFGGLPGRGSKINPCMGVIYFRHICGWGSEVSVHKIKCLSFWEASHTTSPPPPPPPPQTPITHIFSVSVLSDLENT